MLIFDNVKYRHKMSDTCFVCFFMVVSLRDARMMILRRAYGNDPSQLRKFRESSRIVVRPSHRFIISFTNCTYVSVCYKFQIVEFLVTYGVPGTTVPAGYVNKLNKNITIGQTHAMYLDVHVSRHMQCI